MKQQNGFIDPALILIGVGAVVIIGGLAFGLPQYNVWSQSLAGKSELARAEYNRQIAIQEANAKKESAKALADAEVIRAEGVARANQVIAGSLKNNKEYLQYLYIQNLEQGAEKGNKLIMVPIGLDGTPVPTFNVDK
jgi:regulator of protease activity HflC (stomatin/prohibitin superfamily)